MIDTAEIRAAAAVNVGTISFGSAKNLVHTLRFCVADTQVYDLAQKVC
jgi:hypothetical protein